MQTTSDWLEARRHGLTGTDAAAIMGESPFERGTPYQIWLEKTGKAPATEGPEAEWLKWGRRLEPLVVAAYGEDTGRGVLPLEPEAVPGADLHRLDDRGREVVMLQHKGLPVLRCTPDFVSDLWRPLPPHLARRMAQQVRVDVDGIEMRGEVQEHHEGVGLGEAKTADTFKASDWREGPPIYYRIQLQMNLCVSGLSWGSIPLLLGGNRFRVFDEAAHPGFHEYLVNQLGTFWDDYVVKDTPPPLDTAGRDLGVVRALGGDTSKRRTAELPAYFLELYQRRAELHKAITDATKEADWIDSRVIARLGDADVGAIKDAQERWTYKAAKYRARVCGSCDAVLSPERSQRTLKRGKART